MKQKEYTIADFPDRLKALRLSRNYKSTRNLAREIGIPHQTLFSWEAGRKIPTIKSLTRILNFFKVDIRYFFTASGQDFLHAAAGPELPFTETNISKTLFFYLDHIKPGISVISYPGNIGMSRTLAEYELRSSARVKYFCGDYRDLQRYDRIIIDDADKLNDAILEKIFAEKRPVVLVGIDILDKLEKRGYIKKIISKMEMQYIGWDDVDKIMQKALPGISSAIAACIRLSIMLNLKALTELVREIRQRQAAPGFKLDLDIVVAILT